MSYTGPLTYIKLTNSKFRPRLMSFVKFNPFQNDKFESAFKLKEFADNNFKFDENGRMFFKWVENTVGKGEIARYDQFLLFP